jgi:hypothetical protein
MPRAPDQGSDTFSHVRTDMVVSGQTESRADVCAAGTDMSASIAICRKAGLCSVYSKSGTAHHVL